MARWYSPTPTPRSGTASSLPDAAARADSRGLSPHRDANGQVWTRSHSSVTPHEGVARYGGALADGGQRPTAGRRAVEAEQKYPLPSSKAELRIPERNLFRPGTDQEPDEALPVAELQRHEPSEQILEVLEKTCLSLVHADDARLVSGRDVGDPVAMVVACELVGDVVRNVDHGQRGQRAGDRVRDLYGSHVPVLSSRSAR